MNEKREVSVWMQVWLFKFNKNNFMYIRHKVDFLNRYTSHLINISKS